MRRECQEHFPCHQLQSKSLVSDPDMHHGTCVMQVPWCMLGSLTDDSGKTFPAFPALAQPAILRIWKEVHFTSDIKPVVKNLWKHFPLIVILRMQSGYRSVQLPWHTPNCGPIAFVLSQKQRMYMIYKFRITKSWSLCAMILGRSVLWNVHIWQSLSLSCRSRHPSPTD